MGAALTFEVLACCHKTNARASNIRLNGTIVEAPVFMPVGTQGTMKGITSRQLQSTSCRIMLGNTYHLGLRPGLVLMKEIGGLHKMASWSKALLTDSGGFQMVSLSKLAVVTEEGVLFESPRDGSEMLLTPEMSMDLQVAIGANIVMQLDDVVSPLTERSRMAEAMARSVRWLDRCVVRLGPSPRQNLFAIIQGGLDFALRDACIEEMIKRDTPGYAIGGLGGGEDKDSFWRVVKFCADRLPKNKPIYCMGIGYTIDILVCVALGVDMFDCVFVTRTARFGHALIRTGSLSLKQAQYASDFRPIDEACACSTCQSYTRAFLHSSLAQETVACHLITVHNLHFQLNFMREMRESILGGRFDRYAAEFVSSMFPANTAPQWVIDAFSSVQISLTNQ